MIDVGRLKRIGSHDQRVRHKVRILPGADDDVVFRQSEAIVKNRLRDVIREQYSGSKLKVRKIAVDINGEIGFIIEFTFFV